MENCEFKKILKCKKCKLHKENSPLLDILKEADIIFVGLSAKKKTVQDEVPLDEKTKSGKLVLQMMEIAKQYGLSSYRTNLVKCAPLDECGKLRYPSKEEVNCCFSNLTQEIEQIKPKIIILLGDIVQKTIENKKQIKIGNTNNCEFPYTKAEDEEIFYVASYHPSYVLRSKERTKIYLGNFKQLLEDLFDERKKEIKKR